MATRRFGWFFMTIDDLVAFGRQVEQRCPEVTWSTTNRGLVVHRNLAEAADSGGLVRIVTSDMSPPIWLRPSTLHNDLTLRAGSMAYKFDAADYGGEAVAVLNALANGVRQALLATTSPRVVDSCGQRRRNYRIGAEAEEWFRSTEAACLKAESTYETFGLPDVGNRPDLAPA